jgi:hypothetical protein
METFRYLFVIRHPPTGAYLFGGEFQVQHPFDKPFDRLRKFSGRSLSSAEQRGARIEGCGLAKTRRDCRILRYDLRCALRQAQDAAPVYSGCYFSNPAPNVKCSLLTVANRFETVVK